jgi:signal transduction histidine kinase
MILDSNYMILTDTYQLNHGKYLISENAVKAMTGVLSEDENNQIKGDYMECYIPVADTQAVTTTETAGEDAKKKVDDGRQEPAQGLMVVTASVKDSRVLISYLSELSKTLLVLFGICILVVAILIVLLLTHYFNELSRSIEAVAEGNPDREIHLRGFTEIRRLADAFNAAVEKLDKLEESRQEFVSNVSHELKTPITSIKVLADSLVTQDDVPAEVYREFMEDIVEEIDRENKIINDLLSLVKLDRKSGNVLNVTTVNINDLLELLLKRLRPLAAKRNIEVVYESFRAVNAEIDETKLTLALSNLIENAIKYNIDDGWIRITLNADHKYFYVKIADSGVGIPEDCQDHVFERFYRVDKARSRDTGGTGLGLAITHSIVSMHHGTIKLHSRPMEGTTFTVRIPLTYSVSISGAVTNVPETSGNIGEVLAVADQNLKQQAEEEEKSAGPVVTEPAPLKDAEPEVVVLNTEDMEKPEVVVAMTEETPDGGEPDYLGDASEMDERAVQAVDDLAEPEYSDYEDAVSQRKGGSAGEN